MTFEAIEHPIPPVHDEHSRVLILGSFPSVLSRAQGFFYGNPQNRFWKVLAGVLEQPVPESVEEKKAFLLKNRIALYDAAISCEIVGSSDSALKNAIPADLSPILTGADIRAVFANGKKAWEITKAGGQETILLPSTSPANARWKLEMLIETWAEALLPVLGDERA